MKQTLPLIAILTITFTLPFCTFKNADNFEFGIKYNPVRQKFGSPLIKHNMITHNCCGEWTIYEIDKIPTDSNAYHSSKTIRAITNGKLTNEEDIFRKYLNDTTVIQLNIITGLSWTDNRLEISGSIGKVDKRALIIKAEDVISENSKYPNYEFKKLKQEQIDSVLNTWNFSRFDKE